MQNIPNTHLHKKMKAFKLLEIKAMQGSANILSWDLKMEETWEQICYPSREICEPKKFHTMTGQ